MLSRRTMIGSAFALGAATTLGVHCRLASAQTEYTYKFATNLPLVHPMNVRLLEAFKKIRADTNGALNIQLYPNNQLGGDTYMLSQLRSGALEMFNCASGILANVVPVASIDNVGFAFRSYEDIFKAMDGELGSLVRSKTSSLTGLVLLDKMWNSGFRQMTTSTRPITSPDDVKGFKVRVPVTAIFTAMWKSLGANPTSINFSELYTALQTHIVDGQDNPLPIIYDGKLYEVQKYCALTSHVWEGYWTAVSPDAWGRLPSDMQSSVRKHLTEAALAERADIVALEGSLRAQLTAKGLVFNQPDITPFRSSLRDSGFYSEWKTKFGDDAWTTLEKYTGRLA